MNFIDKNTVIILHANKYKDDSFNDFEIINNNSVIDNEGKFGKCFKFENNSKIKLPNDIFNEFRSGDFTLDFWLNQTNFNNYYPSPIFLGDGYTTNRGIWCHSNNSFELGIAFEDNTVTKFVLSPNPIQLNRWYHIALVRNGNEYILFFDGVEKERQTYNKNVNNPNGNIFIGGTNDVNECCNCKIDEFRITKRALWISNFTPSNSEYKYRNLTNNNSLSEVIDLNEILIENLSEQKQRLFNSQIEIRKLL